MTRPLPGYSPLELDPDPGASGLVPGTTPTGLGAVRHHHAERRGSDTATVMLHGAAGSWTTWTPLLRTARQAGVPFSDVVAIDLPGWGGSELDATDGEATVDAIADAVRAVVDGLGYARWRLVGHSMGGFIALHLAAREPGRAVSVELVSPTTYSVIESVAHPVRAFRVIPGFTMMLGVMRTMRRLGRPGTALIRGVGRIRLMRPVALPLFAHGWRVRASVVAAIATEARPRAFSLAAEVTRGYDADGLWARIVCPVVAVRGDDDVFVSPADLGLLARTIPALRSAVVRDAGHFAHVERPVETLRALGRLG
ncbi:alpha/beta hydrolase [Clavibacter michiganensis]|uniref:Alpha/beta hydrolase n=1 Tax=Clavibacter michiganensis TaxID=28447 RepID=A0A2S5VR26_9MICO|nr:alpha/beta hydrolase [Clavibacter michiganensis]PPF65718.1 alpha/beta hydrolase [Clavibacter michiganensis]